MAELLDNTACLAGEEGDGNSWGQDRDRQGQAEDSRTGYYSYRSTVDVVVAMALQNDPGKLACREEVGLDSS